MSAAELKARGRRKDARDLAGGKLAGIDASLGIGNESESPNDIVATADLYPTCGVARSERREQRRRHRHAGLGPFHAHFAPQESVETGAQAVLRYAQENAIR